MKQNSDEISHKNVLAFRDDHKRSDEIRIEKKNCKLMK